MDKYYYFVAQLPLLAFNREAPVAETYFLEEARKWLSTKDYSVLSQVNTADIDVSIKRHRVVDEYRYFESNVRHDLAGWRKARRLNQDYKPTFLPPALLKEGNPLEIETKLLQIRWNFIEERIQGHHFDLGFLILYYLKLQILSRLATFNKEKGMEKFKKLYEVNNGSE